jgi:hypothetical protein
LNVMRLGITRADGTEEVSEDGEETNADTTEEGGGVDLSSKSSLDLELIISVSWDGDPVLEHVLGNIFWGLTRDINPSLREDGTGGNDDDDVEDGVDGVIDHAGEGGWGVEVVDETRHWVGAASISGLLPLTKQSNEEEAAELSVQQLRDEEEVGDEG